MAQTSDDERKYLELESGSHDNEIERSEIIRGLLFRGGAVNYSLVKLEFYKQLALDALAEAEKTGAQTERLKVFLQ